MKIATLLASLTITSVLAAPSSAATVLKTEPAAGALRKGESVLVDDASCPKGKIRQLIGGSDRSGSAGKRQSRCIRRN